MDERDPWAMLALPGTAKAATYLVSQYATQYRLIVDVLHDERNVTLTGVGFDQLAALLRQRLPTPDAAQLLDELDLEARMKTLVEWGTCTSWQDKAETQEDFLRNRHRYQLSDAGYHFNQAARVLDAEHESASTAVLLAPATLLERLSAMLTALDAGRVEAAGQEYSQLQTTLQAMSQAATGWQNRLAVALGGALSEANVTRVLETILTYADMWGAGVDAWSGPIAARVPRLRDIPTEQWRAMALARVGTKASDALVEAAAAEMLADVDVLATWFYGANPQAVTLRRQIRDAVAPVLRGHRALLAIGGAVSRKADLLRLANALECAPTDAEAWRIWCTATGLFSARHVSDAAPEVSGETTTSVWDAPPVPISRRLRTQGSRSLSGRPPHIVDRRAARAEARRQAHRDRLNAERAAAALAARSGTTLNEWAPLTEPETTLLLDLVSSARGYRTGQAPCQAISPDGRYTIILTPAPGSAALTTPRGHLVLPNAHVEFHA